MWVCSIARSHSFLVATDCVMSGSGTMSASSKIAGRNWCHESVFTARLPIESTPPRCPKQKPFDDQHTGEHDQVIWRG
jgi:hypothetical protein